MKQVPLCKNGEKVIEKIYFISTCRPLKPHRGCRARLFPSVSSWLKSSVFTFLKPLLDWIFPHSSPLSQLSERFFLFAWVFPEFCSYWAHHSISSVKTEPDSRSSSFHHVSRSFGFSIGISLDCKQFANAKTSSSSKTSVAFVIE